MKSPFPGMDPYLESPTHWSDFHHRFVTDLAEAINRQLPKTPVMRELPPDKRRNTRLHQRGNFLDPGEEMQPAVLAAFGPLPPGAPLNRLGAAQWLVARANPLTPRAASAERSLVHASQRP